MTNDKSTGDVDPSGIFGTSPLCDERSNGMKLEAGGRAQTNCRWSGSIAEPHPIANYGLDQHADPDLTKPDTVFPSILQAICQLIWVVLLYAIRGVLLLLELGFSNDLVNGAMGAIKRGLAHLNSVFGTDSWQLAAISILGLWGIWTGLVRRKTIQTVGGLAAAVALMIAAQVIMIRPEATVGHVARLSSQGALTALSGASTGTVSHPADSFAQGDQQLFDTLVVRPWCALEFSNVDGCLKLQKAKGQAQASIADVWLSYSANGPERDLLYKHLDGKPFDLKITPKQCKPSGIAGWIDSHANSDSLQKHWDNFLRWGCEKFFHHPKNQGKISLKYDDAKAGVHTDASIQGKDGVFTRLAILGMIALGLVAAICVLLWIGIRLLLAGVFSLVLILFAPIVFLMAAFGEPGRRSVLAWGQRLFGLLVAKFVFAVLLAVVVLVVGMLNSLHMPWFALWMLHIAFWWGLLLKRDELLGFLTLDRRVSEPGLGVSGGGRGTSLGSIYYGWQMTRAAWQHATAPARMAISAGRNQAARTAAEELDRANELEDQRADAREASENLDLQHRTAESGAIREHDRNGLADEARSVREATERRDARRARAILRSRSKAEAALDANRERRQQIERRLSGPRPPWGERYRRLKDEQSRLEAEAPILRKQVDAWDTDDGVAAVRWASDTLRRSKDRPRDLGAHEVDAYITQRRQDIASLPPEHERNLIAAGINPDVYARATPGEQGRLRDQSERAMQRSRVLIGSATAAGVLSRVELDREWRRVGRDPSGMRATVRSGEELRNVRRVDAERQAQRARDQARHNRDSARDRRARRHEEEVWARARRRVR